jgi:hypothetical protein
MANLGALWYTLGVKDMTDADLKAINKKLQSLNAKAKVTVKPIITLKDIQEAVKGSIKVQVTPLAVSNEALNKAAEGKFLQVAVKPLAGTLREELRAILRDTTFEASIGPNSKRLRELVQSAISRAGYTAQVSGSKLDPNFKQTLQAKIGSTQYTVNVTCNPTKLQENIETALKRAASIGVPLKPDTAKLRTDIQTALDARPFTISVKVDHSSARAATQAALNTNGITSTDAGIIKKLSEAEYKQAQAALAKEKTAHLQAADAANTHARASVNLNNAMNSNIRIAGELGGAMAGIYSINAAKEFLQQIVEIGGELEHQKIAMNTIFGDKGKTIDLYGQIKGLARNSPFGVMELTKSVKALSAYGVEYNEIYDTAKRLADISAATSVDINRLILAFGKTKSRGFLDGLEAKQFAYANIPIYELIRKKLEELEGQAVTTADVMARMKKREIGFDVVKDVLWDVTDEGGKFYNMQEALAGSVKTSWKLVRDNLDLMFGDMAEGAIGRGLKSLAEMLQGLTRNWQTLGTIIATGATVLGVYKLGMLGLNTVVRKSTVAAYDEAMALQQKSAAKLREEGITRQLTAAELAQLKASNKLTNANLARLLQEKELTTAQLAGLRVKGLINKQQVLYLMHCGLITKEQARMVLSANAYTLALKGMQTAFKNFIASTAKMIFNPWTALFAGLSAVMSLWQKHSEENSNADDLGRDMLTKAEGAAKSLNDALKEVGDTIEGLSSIKLAEAIKKFETAIRDYSPTAEHDIREAKIDMQGRIRDEEAYAEALKHRVEMLEKAEELAEDKKVGELVAESIKMTGSLFDDNMTTDFNDFVKSYQEVKNSVTGTLTSDWRDAAQEMVDVASKSDAAFKKQAESMQTLEEKYSALLVYSRRYKAAWDGIYDYWNNGNGSDNFNELYRGIKTETINPFWINQDKALGELDEFMENIRSKFIENGIDATSEVGKIILSNVANQIFQPLSNLPSELQEPFKEKFNEFFNIDFDDSAIFGAFTESAKKSMDKLLGKDLADKLRNGVGVDQLTDAEKDLIKKLYENAAEEVKKQMPDLAYWIQKSLNDQQFTANVTLSLSKYADLNDWQKEIIEKFGGNPTIDATIRGAADIPSFVKGVRDAYAAAEKDLKQMKGLKMPLGFEFTGMKPISTITKEYMALNAEQKQAVNDFNKLLGVMDTAKEVGSDYGFDPSVDPTKKQKQGSQKDKVAEAIKQRLKDVKDAWSEYQKWQKTLGDEGAFDKIANSGLFSTLDSNQIPRSVEQYKQLIAGLKAELEKAGVKGHSQRESLLNDMLTQLLNIDQSEVSRQVKSALDAINKTASQELANWNLFDKVYKATGNRQFAENFAFGFGADAVTDYRTMIKNQFNEAVADLRKTNSAIPDVAFDEITSENYKSLPEDVQNLWAKATQSLTDYNQKQKEEIADILTQYQDTQDKIDSINAKRKNALETVNRKDEKGGYVLDETTRNHLTTLINAEADSQIFQQSDDYLKFFNNVYAMTLDEATRIGDLIQANLNKKLQAGLITIYEYEQEMEKVRKQVDAVRNVKSNAFNFLTGGVKGRNSQKLSKAEGELATNQAYQDKLKELAAEQEKLNSLQGKGQEAERAAQEEKIENIKKELAGYTQVRDAIVKNEQSWEKTAGIANIAASAAQGLSDSFNTIKDFAESLFGADTDKGVWQTIQAAIDTMTTITSGIQKVIQSAMNGDVGGILSGAVDTVLTPFTLWGKLHDKKLQDQIDELNKNSEALESLRSLIDSRMTYFLGNGKYMSLPEVENDRKMMNQLISTAWKDKNANRDDIARYSARVSAYETGGAYGYERQLLQENLDNLEKQKSLAENMKNKDEDAIAQYDEEIEEARLAVEQFAEETANTLYGIDIKGWASDLGDALYEAWQKGEDGAQAFKDAASDILGDVMNEVLKLGILEPMMKDVQTYLFGSDGQSGAFGSDFELDNSEVETLADMVMKGAAGVDAYAEALDNLEEYLQKNYGMTLKDDDSSSSTTESIQGVTEDTAGLIASYMNAIRAHTALIEQYEGVNSEYLSQIVAGVSSLPRVSELAQAQLVVQQQIANNTAINANAAVAIQELLTKASNGTLRFYVA